MRSNEFSARFVRHGGIPPVTILPPVRCFDARASYPIIDERAGSRVAGF
jgi:hypothetical protein